MQNSVGRGVRDTQEFEVWQRDETSTRVGFDKRPDESNIFQCLVNLKCIDKVGHRRSNTVKSKIRQVGECVGRNCRKAPKDYHTKVRGVRSGGNGFAAKCAALDV